MSESVPVGRWGEAHACMPPGGYLTLPRGMAGAHACTPLGAPTLACGVWGMGGVIFLQYIKMYLHIAFQVGRASDCFEGVSLRASRLGAHLSACRYGNQSVDPPCEDIDFPRARGARFRPSQAGFGGVPSGRLQGLGVGRWVFKL